MEILVIISDKAKTLYQTKIKDNIKKIAKNNNRSRFTNLWKALLIVLLLPIILFTLFRL